MSTATLAEAPAARRGGRARGLLSVSAVLAVLLLVLWRTGPGLVPFLLRFEEIARSWPRSPVEDREAYVLRAPLGQVVYALLPTQTVDTFLTVHVLGLLATLVVLAVWLLVHCGRGAGAAALVVLLLSPVTAVVLLWVGMYDAFSVLAWSVLLASLSFRGPVRLPVQVAAGAVCGVQNFEQSIIGVVLVALLPELSRRARLHPSIPALVGGLVLGKAVLEVFLRGQGAPDGSRLSFLLDDPSMIVATFTTSSYTLPVMLFSAFGGLWVWVLPMLQHGWPTWATSTRVRVVLAGLGWMGAGIVALDHSRALALTGLPIVAMVAIVVAERHGDVLRLLRTPATWLVLLIPPVIVWDRISLSIGVKPGSLMFLPFV